MGAHPSILVQKRQRLEMPGNAYSRHRAGESICNMLQGGEGILTMDNTILVVVMLAGVAMVAGVSGAGGYGGTPTVSGHTLGELEGANTLCRAAGTNCPAPGGSLSCTQVNGPLQDTSSQADCASGYKVTGGGCSFTHESGGWYQSKENSNGWYCAAACYGSCTADVRAYATCCKIA